MSANIRAPSSSSDGSLPVEGSNRDEAPFNLTIPSEEEDDKQHNYSVTRRWRERLATFENWLRVWTEKATADNFDTLTETLEFPSRTDMYLAEKPEYMSPLGTLLDKFRETIEEMIAKLRDDTATPELRYAYFQIVEEKADRTGARINILYNEHASFKDKLAVESSKGNEFPQSGTRGSRRTSLDSDRFDKSKAPSPSDLYKDMTCSVESRNSLRQVLSTSVSQEAKQSLRAFQKFVSNIFKGATATDDDKYINTTINAILNWEEVDGLDDNTKETYGRPPTDNDCETKADHPILHALVCRIIRIIDDKHRPADEPTVTCASDYGVTTEQSIVGSSETAGSARRIDITVQMHTEHLAARLPAMIHFPLEIKTAPDDTIRFIRRVKKGRLQTVGHLAKKIEHAFHFGGAGVNAAAIGVSLTQLSIEVIELKLSGAGTNEVKISEVSTGLMPLGLDSTMESKHGLKSEQKESGIFLLAGAILYANGKGISYQQMKISPMLNDRPIKYIDHLGTGAFANAFEIDTDEFMKVPLSASQAKSLEHEAAILKKLADRIESIPDSIPKLANLVAENLLSDLCATIRDEVSIMKGLRLKGIVGVSLNKFRVVDWKGISETVVSQVCNALKTAHKVNIFHMDVRPSNIIVEYSAEDKNTKVMLSDWGCATSDKKLKKFRGCTPYAHDSLLGMLESFNIKARPELDFASLVYTIIRMTEGKLPWHCEFDRPWTVTFADKKKRKDFVNQWFPKNESLLPEDYRDMLKDAVLQRRSERKRKQPSY